MASNDDDDTAVTEPSFIRTTTTKNEIKLNFNSKKNGQINFAKKKTINKKNIHLFKRTNEETLENLVSCWFTIVGKDDADSNNTSNIDDAVAERFHRFHHKYYMYTICINLITCKCQITIIECNTTFSHIAVLIVM